MHPLMKPSLPFDEIATAAQRPPYFSPKAENVGLPVADRYVFRVLSANGGLASVDQLWAGFFVDSSHSFIFRDKQAKACSVLKFWVFPPCNSKRSACLAWPVELQTVPEYKDQYLVFRQLHDKLVWVT